MPLQLGDALWRAQSADIRPVDSPGGLVVCGMGGSAIGGDLALAALGDRATRPIYVVRGYAIESWTPPETLVLCSSYSGETEETLACFEAAGAAGARRVVLTTGGSLAEAARAEGRAGDRRAVRHAAARGRRSTGSSARSSARWPAAPRRRSTPRSTRPRRCSSGSSRSGARTPPTTRLPKRLAHDLRGTLPVIHGSGPTVAIARRWHTQLNENAKVPAFWSELPEANHNEICAWERGTGLAPLAAVFLEDPDQHPRIGRRIDLTCEEVERSGAPAIRVKARGESRLERVLSHLLLGDLVSVYLAALEGVDPTPVEAIERLKAGLP